MTTDRTPLISSRQPKTNGGYVNGTTATPNDGADNGIEPQKQKEEPQFNIPGITHRDFVLILTGLWSATFLGSLDGTVVATIVQDVGTTFEKSNMASWLGTSYLLSVCCFTPIYGRLCDIIGRRGAMLTALSFFGIGTIGCGFAPSMETLILARAVAGAGGGAMMSVGSIIVTDLSKPPSPAHACAVLIPFWLPSSPPVSRYRQLENPSLMRSAFRRKRGLYQGLANCCFGLGAGLGGPLGKSRPLS
jgi:MFS family permease